MSEPIDVVVTNNPAELRFEVRVGEELAGSTTYLRHGDQVVFTHAEVDPKWEGQGIGSQLAREALDEVVADGLVITPLCPFIVNYLSHHPDYLPHVDEVHRQEIEAMIAVDPDDVVA